MCVELGLTLLSVAAALKSSTVDTSVTGLALAAATAGSPVGTAAPAPPPAPEAAIVTLSK